VVGDHLSDGARPDLSFIVPVYNSEQTIESLVSRLEAIGSAGSCGFEAVLVNDASTDGSAAALERLCERRPWVRVIHHARNLGQHQALWRGILSARGRVLVTLDDDLQHPPEEIPALLALIAAGSDLVYGNPRRSGHGAARNLASRLAKFAIALGTGAGSVRHTGAFRAFRAELGQALPPAAPRLLSIDAALCAGARRVAVVEVEHRPRTVGKSRYGFLRLLRHTLSTWASFHRLRAGWHL
jgi:undecaprenyl-phosphate 4-deoxy-4-formamido-L-arabinose transferase